MVRTDAWFTLKQSRKKHIFIIGKYSMGKSTKHSLNRYT